jgi:heptosyltransferase-2
VTSALVIQTSFLGDAVLTTPLITYLARFGPVDVVTTSAASALLANNPAIRRGHAYDKRGHDAGVPGFLRVAGTLRRHRYDVAYLAQGSVRSAALAVAARIPLRVGFATAAGRLAYTRRVPIVDGIHHTARLLSLATPSTHEEPSRDALQPRLYPGDAERRAVDALLGEPQPGHTARRRPPPIPLLALAPGSAWATKQWPHYPELARRIAPRVQLAIIGGPEDGDAARAIAAAAAAASPSRIIDATGRLSPLASAELIGRAAAVVSNDSLPQHLASAMGTPTLTIFGPTVPEFGFGPLAPCSTTAGVNTLPCRPCHHHGPPRCPLRHWRCMRTLGPAQVETLLIAMTG